MNEMKDRILGFYKSMSPISSTLIKLYIPIILTLVLSIAAVGIAYAVKDTQVLLDLMLDCVQTLKSTLGIALITLIISRVISR